MDLKKTTPLKLLLVLIGLIALSSCKTANITLHPIGDEDIFPVVKGHTCAEKEVVKDGYFVSTYYMEEVMRVRTE